MSNRGPLGFAVVSLILSLTPIACGVVRGVPERHELAASTIAPELGASFITPSPRSRASPLLGVETDDREHPMRSIARLYEDGRRLGPPHAQPASIRNAGRGQFSHSRTTLHFSTSDNSDPRTNGRQYVLVTRARLPFAAAWLWALLFAAPALRVWWRASSRPVWGAAAPRKQALWCGLGAAVVGMAALTTFEAGGRFAGPGALLAIWGLALLTATVLAIQSGRAFAALDVRSIASSMKTTAVAAQRRLRAAADVAPLSAPVERWFNRPGAIMRFVRWSTLLVPAVAFAAALLFVLPPGTLTSAYYSLTPVVLGAAVALWCCYWRSTWLSTVAGLTVTLVLFALPLAALWQDVAYHENAIGGLLPFSDASGYYYDARRLLDGHRLGWSARRPLFVGLMSTLLALTEQNLQLTIAAFVAINAVAAFLLARELRASHGRLAATAATIVLFLFYRVAGGLGTTLTENLGLALGTCGFAALLRGARLLDPRSLFLGSGLLTLGLMSRAGAFFVLPMVVLAIAWMFRADRRWLRMGAGAAGALLLATVVAFGVGRWLTDPAVGQSAFSNFSYSLYGLVVGGKGWNQVLQDHPGAQEGAEIYSLAYQAFVNRPMGVVEGSLRMWDVYFTPSSGMHAFAFVTDSGSVQLLAQLACYALSAIALVAAAFRLRRPQYALILAATAGHIASIPLVPPVDAGLRVYAATVPLLASLVAIGSSSLLELVGRVGRAARQGMTSEMSPRALGPAPRTAEWFGVVLASAALAGPVLLLQGRRPAPMPELSCAAGTSPVYIRVSEGSSLRITNPGDAPRGPHAAVEIVETLLPHTAGRIELRSELPKFTAGNTMVNGYDLGAGGYVWLVAPTEKISQGPGVYAVCGHPSSDRAARNYGVFYADEVWRFQPDPRR